MKKVLIIILLSFMLVGCNGKEKELSCVSGSLVDGRCQITETSEVLEKCREGYERDSETNKCVNTIVIAAKKVSECPNGYYIGSDNWCFSEKEYEKEVKLNCESPNIPEDDNLSSTYVKDNVCYEKLCVTFSEDKTTCEEFKETVLMVKVEESCPSGTKSVEGVCRKKYWMNKEFSCELGEKEGNNCVIKDEIDADYYCEDGYKLNKEKNICEKIIYEEAVLK